MLIRLSPSGPPIQNTDGGTAETGPGFLLRMAEDTIVIDPAFGTWGAATPVEVKPDPATLIAPFLRPRLDDPKPNRRYRVTAAVDLSNNVAATVTITSTIQVSYDEGASWNVLVTQESEMGATNQRKHVRIDQPLTLGSALADPVTDPPPASIMVRVLMESSTPNVEFMAPGGTSGAALVQLTEHL